MKRKFVKPTVTAFDAKEAWGQDQIHGDCVSGLNPSNRFVTTNCNPGIGPTTEPIIPVCLTGTGVGNLPTACTTGGIVYGDSCSDGSLFQ